ncbi:MAG: hypothetical protein RBS56_00250 [Candidatus Gracilibacteria bacterium]|jgi:hypothetical protein|nr:hypothetical protein [Candidatus Gracilibacteria bacterium]
MNTIEAFKTVRDMPYRIPLALKEKDVCCSGKHKLLKDMLEKQGFEVRYRVCTFLWSSIDLPEKVSSVQHHDNNTHVWLETLVNNEWIIADATWDSGLKNIFHINDWDGKSNTQPAVKPIEIFSPQKSADIMNNYNDEDILNDLEINGEFYKAFNDWLEEQRASVSE